MPPKRGQGRVNTRTVQDKKGKAAASSAAKKPQPKGSPKKTESSPTSTRSSGRLTTSPYASRSTANEIPSKSKCGMSPETPTLGRALRSSSPATRSQGNLNRNDGSTQKTTRSRKTATPSTTSPAARGRGRQRGRGRGGAGKSRANTSDDSIPVDSSMDNVEQEAAEDLDAPVVEKETATEMESEQSNMDMSAELALNDNGVDESADISTNEQPLSQSCGLVPDPAPTLNSNNISQEEHLDKSGAVVPDTIPSEAEEIAQLADRLVNEEREHTEWTKNDDDIIENLTDEHMKQLESVLTSEEGMQFLEQQGLVEDEPEIHDLTNVVGDQGITKLAGPTKTFSPRRSERVTDKERRALAEKIRQENIKKEKEELEKIQEEKLAAEKEKQEEELAAAAAIQAAQEQAEKEEREAELEWEAELEREEKRKKTPAKPKAQKKEEKPKSALKKTSEHQKSTDKSTTKKEHKDKPKKEKSVKREAEVTTPDTPVKPVDGGWIPGKVKVIDRRSDSEKKRKSAEDDIKRRLSSTDDLFKPDEPVTKQSRREAAKKSLREDEVEMHTDSEVESEPVDDTDEEWADDDPDRLWCVCRKPHDNRFMICCDRCEEWYHGDCVGISKRRGQQMEEEDEEYICSVCKEKEMLAELGEEGMAEILRRDEKPEETSQTQTDKLDKTEAKEETMTVKGEIRKKSANSGEKKKFQFKRSLPKQHCIGSGCDNWALEGQIYCSFECIKKHCKESVRIIEKEKAKLKGASLKEPAGKAPNLVVMERHTGRLVTGAHAPNADNLIAWITKHPTFEILRPGQRTGHVSSNFYGKSHSKLISSNTDINRNSNTTKETAVSSKKSSGPDTASIRSSVRKHLSEILNQRVKDSGEEICSQEDIQTIVSSVEHELHKFYGEPNSKYKARYRSLVFNIKDSKNKGLFRKILKKKLKPSKLVRMTPDELASKELHEWREKEIKSELEKIKKEEESRAHVTPIRKITHKGEIEINEDLSSLPTKLTESKKDYELEDRIKSNDLDRGQMSDSSYDVLSTIMGSHSDTTSQHMSHLFDSNCKICTGKITAPKTEPVRKPTVSHQISIGKPTVLSSTSEIMQKVVKEEKVEKDRKPSHETHNIGENILKRQHSSQNSQPSQKPHYTKITSPLLSPKRSNIEKSLPSPHLKSPPLKSPPLKSPPLTSPPLTSPPLTSPPLTTTPSRAAQSPYQEPSSTVKSPGTPPISPTVVEKKKKHKSAWKGFINVPELSKFFTQAYPIHGNTETMNTDLPDCLEIVGRIHPKQIWEYVDQLKHAMTREVVLVRFTPVGDEEKEHYIEYFKYLSHKHRCGVVGNAANLVKDMYIIPLPSHESLPSALKPYRHKVLSEDNRPHMLLGLLVKIKSKRPVEQPPLLPVVKSKKTRADLPDDSYEPPGLADLVPPEPADSTPDLSDKTNDADTTEDIEEYDPTQPLVDLATQKQPDNIMDEPADEEYDPIVSAYSHADSSHITAEDDPADEPYTPGEGDEPYSPDSPYSPVDEPYSPGAANTYNPSSTSSSYTPVTSYTPVAPPPQPSTETPPTVEAPPLPPDPPQSDSTPKVSSFSDQEKALRELKEQVEKQRRLLEEKKAEMQRSASTVLPGVPMNISDIITGKTIPDKKTPEPYNMMDYLKRTIDSKKAQGVQPPPPLPSSFKPTETTSPELDRPKISFSLSSSKPSRRPSLGAPSDERPPAEMHSPPVPPTFNSPPFSQNQSQRTFDYGHVGQSGFSQTQAYQKPPSQVPPPQAMSPKSTLPPVSRSQSSPSQHLPPQRLSAHDPPAHSPSRGPSYGPPSHGPPSHGPPSHGPRSHSNPSHGPASYAPRSHGPPSHGPPVHDPSSQFNRWNDRDPRQGFNNQHGRGGFNQRGRGNRW